MGQLNLVSNDNLRLIRSAVRVGDMELQQAPYDDI